MVGFTKLLCDRSSDGVPGVGCGLAIVLLDGNQANIGSLVNYAEPSTSPQHMIHRDSTSASPMEFASSNVVSEDIGRSTNDFNFDAFLVTNVLETDWTSTVSQIDIPGDWLAADASQGLEPTRQLDQHIIESDAQAVTFEDWLTLHGPTDAPDPSTQDAGRSVGAICPPS